MTRAAVLVGGLGLILGCGSSSSGGPAATTDGGAVDSSHPSDATTDTGSMQMQDSGAPGDGATQCLPTIPQIPWTSPYAGWSRGIPTDPSFFPIAVWLQGSWHAQELHDLGVNIYVGNNAGTDPMMASDLAILKGLGMYAIIGQDSVGLASVADPTIVGWWMSPDEPDNAQPNGTGGYGPPVDPATMVTEHDTYKSGDSTRPAWLGLGQGVAYDGWEGRGSNPPLESSYVPASDIVSFDIYPYNNCGGDPNEQVTCGQFWLNAFGVDRLHQWSNRNQAVWTDIETTVIAAGSTAGPTPTQTISEVWLSLIHGANGICYFIDTWNPTFKEDGIFNDPTMVAAVTGLNQEIKSLAPELNSASLPNLVTVTSSNAMAPIDAMVKANGSTLYVFSAISKTGTAMASFTVVGMTGNAMATVVGESRNVAVTAGKFSDAFGANDVHIYRIDLSTAVCN